MFMISWRADLYVLSYNTKQGKHSPVKHVYPTVLISKRDVTILEKAHLNIPTFIDIDLNLNNFYIFNFSFHEDPINKS